LRTLSLLIEQVGHALVHFAALQLRQFLVTDVLLLDVFAHVLGDEVAFGFGTECAGFLCFAHDGLELLPRGNVLETQLGVDDFLEVLGDCGLVGYFRLFLT